MSNLILIRGVPGSGKSTLARTLVERSAEIGQHAIDLETDRFFTDGISGQYKWSSELLKEAHEWCRLCALKLMYLYDHIDVIVANTFTSMWEMEPYLKMAKKYNRDIIIYDLKTEYDNVHDVPPEKVKQMRDRFYTIRFDMFPEYFGGMSHDRTETDQYVRNHFRQERQS